MRDASSAHGREVGVDPGGGLLSCQRARVGHGGFALRQGPAVGVVGAEDAEMAEETRRRQPRAAFGGGLTGPISSTWPEAHGLPQGLPLSTEPHGVHALRGLSSVGCTVGERGDGGGVQNGVHRAAEAERHEMEEAGSANDLEPACAPAEWRVGPSLCAGVERICRSKSPGSTPIRGNGGRISTTAQGSV